MARHGNRLADTAFIFNLSTSTYLGQRTDGAGGYQTVGAPSYGPTFGGGHDIFANTSLESGYAFAFSYGVSFGTNILDGSSTTSFLISDVEVFTIQEGQDEPAPVPEPSTLLLFGAGLAAAARNHFRRQRR